MKQKYYVVLTYLFVLLFLFAACNPGNDGSKTDGYTEPAQNSSITKAADAGIEEKDTAKNPPREPSTTDAGSDTTVSGDTLKHFIVNTYGFDFESIISARIDHVPTGTSPRSQILYEDEDTLRLIGGKFEFVPKEYHTLHGLSSGWTEIITFSDANGTLLAIKKTANGLTINGEYQVDLEQDIYAEIRMLFS